MPYSNIVFLTNANTSPWTIDATYNPADSKIEIIGRGSSGSTRVSTSQGGNGGGAGAYAVKTNVNLGTGTAAFLAPDYTNPSLTWIKDSSGTIQVQADYGRTPTTANGGAGVGGLASNCIPTTGAQNGGNGGNSVAGADAGGGGGGSGGPNGAGGNGAVGATVNGGSADGGTVAQQTTQGAAGNKGTEWDATHGCGGGGAGGVGGGSRAGGNAGDYGGGGGGCDSGTAIQGIGGNSIIIIQWNPVVTPLGDMIAQQPLQPPGYKW